MQHQNAEMHGCLTLSISATVSTTTDASAPHHLERPAHCPAGCTGSGEGFQQTGQCSAIPVPDGLFHPPEQGTSPGLIENGQKLHSGHSGFFLLKQALYLSGIRCSGSDTEDATGIGPCMWQQTGSQHTN